MAYDVVLRGGSVVTANGCETTDIAVRDGRICAFGGGFAADEIVDCTGLHVLPGVVDTQTHFREPGREWKEDLESGSRAAALGGVTGVFEMPNTDPPTTTPDLLVDKLRRASGRMHVDYAFYAGASTDNTHLLAQMEAMRGCCGVKVFMGESTGSLLIDDDAGIEAVLGAVSRRCAFHCEDNARLRERRHLAVPGDAASHAVVRDEDSAMRATARLLAIAERLGKAVHVLHVSSGAEMEFLASRRGSFSVETTPQHLTFSAPEVYQRLGTHAQMNPPIRSEQHTQVLWQGVRDGVVDTIGSDHAPHTIEEKDAPYPGSPSGMPGVQTLVPVMLTHVAQGRLSLARFVDMTSAAPQRLFATVGKGRIARGYDADFTVVDLKAKRTITAAQQATKCGWTPFDGFVAHGWPVATIVRGQIIMRDDEIVSAHRGEPMCFVQYRSPE